MANLINPGYVSVGVRTGSAGPLRQNQQHDGHIAEILIYDHPLDDLERAAIARYVGSKYGGAPGEIFRRGDANADGAVNLTDGIAVFNFLFLGGDAPPDPGPFDCGLEPAGSPISFGCDSYPPKCK